MKEERHNYTQKIIDSLDPYRLVIAGAGTGKSFTMLQILESNPNKNFLVLTLTNELIKDLEQDLGKHAKCWTFHKLLCDIFKSDLKHNKIIYPRLSELIDDDIKTLGLCEKLSQFVLNLEDKNNKEIKTYFSRADYYNAVGFDEVAYLVVDFLKTNPDKIRNYDLVLIDEFQDFNKLEVELVNIIESKNQMVIVGDDDQSIYNFRGATSGYLREKHKNKKYITYVLPFCSRCTKVIVDSVNNIINKAVNNNILIERIKKDYKCYLPEKQDDSNKHPQIVHKNFSVQRKNANYMGSYIASFYKNIENSEKETAKTKNQTLILIIGQGQFLTRVSHFDKMH